MKKFRTLFLLLVFVLVLAPLNIFAETSKTQINYVSLGDSLAYGLLSDGKSSTGGYAAYIKKSLESNGYQVEFTNKGVPGFTTDHVFNGLPQVQQLSNADIVTISAGANDLLGQIDFDKLIQFNPEFLDETKLDEINQTFIQKAMDVLENGNLVTNLDQSINDLETIVNVYQALLPKGIVENFNNAIQEFNKFKTLFNQSSPLNELDEISHLNEMIARIKELDIHLNNTINSLNNILTQTEHIKNSLPADIQNALNEILTIVTKLSKLSEFSNEVSNLYSDFKNALEVKQMLTNVEQKISTVGGNIDKIIKYIKQVNPNAKIYVMGYYNALPYLSEQLQQYTVPLIQGLNNAIKTATEANGAIFVPTYSVFEGKYVSYLPNPSNIHPGKEGYDALGNAFMNEIKKTYPAIPVNPEVETNITVKLNEKITVHKGQQLTIANTNTTLVLPSDLPDGTVLTVTKTDNAKLNKAKGLKAVGDVLNFHFEFPPGYENYQGKYQLIMKYDGDSSNNVDIYYFDEQSQTWIKQNGKHNKKAKELRLEVSHFSNYGVFVQEETKASTPVFEEDGKPLPKTATNHYNWILAGSIMIVIGLALIGLGKKNFIKVRG